MEFFPSTHQPLASLMSFSADSSSPPIVMPIKSSKCKFLLRLRSPYIEAIMTAIETSRPSPHQNKLLIRKTQKERSGSNKLNVRKL